MLAKSLLLSILASCSVPSLGATADPDDKPGKPPVEYGADDYFCCTTVDQDKYTGEACILISAANVNTCSNVLYCDERWTKVDGDVKCE